MQFTAVRHCIANNTGKIPDIRPRQIWVFSKFIDDALLMPLIKVCCEYLPEALQQISKSTKIQWAGA
ncbi:hypothetical protein HOC_19941 [Hyphomonas oceanitis SCH89]|uniref:Uncharacterized protein n=1 Tax=Hyphomonas oceanitis SCH89 TaxID=1280953 RepID=A0A059G1X6_9PROT|nr:hypothetical protein HOC_19941 [Hyphomonas oceanitis SCH89]